MAGPAGPRATPMRRSKLYQIVVFNMFKCIEVQWSSLISKFFQCTEQRYRDLCINKFAY